MKSITAIIKFLKVDRVCSALEEVGVDDIVMTDVKDFDQRLTNSSLYRGAEFKVDFVPKIRLDITVRDEIAEQIAEAIVNTASTGRIGDGRIFIMDLEQVICIPGGDGDAACP